MQKAVITNGKALKDTTDVAPEGIGCEAATAFTGAGTGLALLLLFPLPPLDLPLPPVRGAAGELCFVGV